MQKNANDYIWIIKHILISPIRGFTLMWWSKMIFFLFVNENNKKINIYENSK